MGGDISRNYLTIERNFAAATFPGHIWTNSYRSSKRNLEWRKYFAILRLPAASFYRLQICDIDENLSNHLLPHPTIHMVNQNQQTIFKNQYSTLENQ